VQASAFLFVFFAGWPTESNIHRLISGWAQVNNGTTVASWNNGPRIYGGTTISRNRLVCNGNPRKPGSRRKTKKSSPIRHLHRQQQHHQQQQHHPSSPPPPHHHHHHHHHHTTGCTTTITAISTIDARTGCTTTITAISTSRPSPFRFRPSPLRSGD
jgi:hypothetical protein